MSEEYPQPKNPKVLGRNVGKQLCEVLGLDPGMVRDITIHCPVDDAVKVSILGYVRRDECDGLTEVLTHYHLASTEDGDG